MVLDWISLAQAFAGIGFPAVVGFLLWERFVIAKRLEILVTNHESELSSVIEKNTLAHKEAAIASNSLAAAVLAQKDAFIALTQEIRIMSLKRRGGKDG